MLTSIDGYRVGSGAQITLGTVPEARRALNIGRNLFNIDSRLR